MTQCYAFPSWLPFCLVECAKGGSQSNCRNGCSRLGPAAHTACVLLSSEWIKWSEGEPFSERGISNDGAIKRIAHLFGENTVVGAIR
jgi:hypothetical protein